MKSVEITASEKKDMAYPSVVSDKPKYPWGLRVTVDGETYKKLDLKEIPQVGDKMMMLCLVEVCSVSNEKYEGDENNISVGLQITDMEIKKSEAEKKPAENMLYGEES